MRAHLRRIGLYVLLWLALWGAFVGLVGLSGKLDQLHPWVLARDGIPSLVALTWSSVASLVRFVRGQRFARRCSVEVRAWETARRPVDVEEAAHFHRLGVSVSEAERLGAVTVSRYRWMRRIERRGGFRWGSAPYTLGGRGGFYEDALRAMVRRYASCWRPWAFTEASRRRLRALAQVIDATRPGPNNRMGLSWEVVDEADRSLRAGDDPVTVVGRVRALAVLTEAGVLNDGVTLSEFVGTWPDQGSLPGWLCALAGFRAGERAPEGANVAGLTALAGLRGRGPSPIDLAPVAPPEPPGQRP